MAAGYGRGGRSAELQNAVTSEAGKGPLAFRRIGPREIPRPAARGAQSDLPGAPWSKWGHPPLQFANVSAPPFDFTFVFFFQNIITTSPVIHSSSAFHALTTHKTTSESSREAHTQSLHTIGFAYIAVYSSPSTQPWHDGPHSPTFSPREERSPCGTAYRACELSRRPHLS